MSKLLIKPEYLLMLRSIFDSYCPNAEIWAYGSRVGGDAHEGSDLDLTIITFGNKECSLFELKEILDESNIPFLVDISEFYNLPESFQAEIKRNYIVIYPVTK